MKSTTSKLMLFIKLRKPHCFNKIILQPVLFADDQEVYVLVKKKRRCYLKDVISPAIKRCKLEKRQGTDLKPLTDNVGKVHLNLSKKGKLNMATLLERSSTYFSSTRFVNIIYLDSFPVIDQKQHGVAKSPIGYLDIVDAPVTYISTVYRACN